MLSLLRWSCRTTCVVVCYVFCCCASRRSCADAQYWCSSSVRLSRSNIVSSSSRKRVINHNWSATKQRLHPQSVAEISRHSSSRMRVMNHNWSVVSHETASSSAECSRDKPPFRFVRGQDSVDIAKNALQWLLTVHFIVITRVSVFFWADAICP